MPRGRPRKPRVHYTKFENKPASPLKVCSVELSHGKVEIMCNSVMTDMHGELFLTIEMSNGDKVVTAGFKEWKSFTFREPDPV